MVILVANLWECGKAPNIDKLYGSVSGSTASGATPEGEVTDPLGGGFPTPPAGGEGAITPESIKRDMNIILERDNIYGVDDIDLEKGSRSLGVIEESLRKLID